MSLGTAKVPMECLGGDQREEILDSKKRSGRGGAFGKKRGKHCMCAWLKRRYSTAGKGGKFQKCRGSMKDLRPLRRGSRGVTGGGSFQ